MPTASKPTKKRAAKKRRPAAAKKDDLEIETAEETKSKKSVSRKSAKSRSKAAMADDDFGGDLIEDDAPAKKPVKKARKAAKKKAAKRKPAASIDADIDFEADESEKKPAKKKRKATKKKKPVDEFAAELDFEAEGDAEEKPKRRSAKKVARKRSSKASDEAADVVAADVASAPEQASTEDGRGSKSRRGGRGSSGRGSSDRNANDDGGERSSETSESQSSENRSGDSRSGERSNENEGEGNRRGRRRRGRRGRGRRGGSDDRGPQQSQRGGKQRGRGGQRDRGPARDIEPVSAHVTGVLEMHPKGYGFVRDSENDYAAQETDPFVSTALIDRFNLREGVLISGEVGAGHRGQGPRLTSIESVEGGDPEDFLNVTHFDKLTPINPEEHIKLEMGPSPITMRVVDLLCPIGKGQRALIVAPPRSGKTILLQQMADAVAFNHPECHLMVMLIDERPEEVTEMRRHVKGEVIASSIDRELENHVRVSQLVIERAKRLAEKGKDVFILLDSITRLARAFNKYTNTGRTGSGGIDVRAMDKPKKIFGSARVFDEGGSITVVGTALVQTGSRMDDVIFEEFKGTGNMELVLSRELADRRIWPAMDIERSGTRREEKLFTPEELEGITMMRRSLISLHPVEAMEQLVRTLAKFDTNSEFLSRIRSIM